MDRQPPSSAAAAVVDCAVYVDGVRLPGTHTPERALDEVRRRGSGFVWRGLFAPTFEQMTAIAQTYGLHELVAEDSVHAHQRPKLEQYDKVTVLVMRTAHYLSPTSIRTADDIVETGEILAAVGSDFIVTVRHGAHTAWAGVRAELEGSPEHLQIGPWAVLHAVIDRIVDGYLGVVGSVDVDIDTLEVELLSPDRHTPIEQIYLVKREVLELRRSVNPLAAALSTLAAATALPEPIPKDVHRHLRDLAEHHAAVAERIVEFDDVISSLVAATLARVNVQQNTDLRKITAWASVAAFVTAFAGIYGMNFQDMPELRWRYGYLLWWIIAVTGAVSLFTLFRRKRWL